LQGTHTPFQVQWNQGGLWLQGRQLVGVAKHGFWIYWCL
jgi:hypothetical protein